MIVIFVIIVSPLTFVISDLFPHSKYILVFIRNHQRFTVLQRTSRNHFVVQFFLPFIFSHLWYQPVQTFILSLTGGSCPPHPAPSPQRSLSEPHSSFSLESPLLHHNLARGKVICIIIKQLVFGVIPRSTCWLEICFLTVGLLVKSLFYFIISVVTCKILWWCNFIR